LQEKQKLIEKYLPELNELYKPRIEAPIIEVFEGKEGIKTVLQDIIETKKEMLDLGSTGRFPQLFPYYSEIFHKERVKNKIKIRIVYNDDKYGRARGKSLSKLSITEVRYMRKTSPTTTYIYGEKVVIIIWEKEKLVAIMIKDKDVAESYRNYFESIWKTAKK